MKNIILISLTIFFAVSCEKEKDKTDMDSNPENQELNTETFATKENVNIVAHKNNPQFFDINNDGYNDIEISLSLTTIYEEDCDPIDENDTISCLPWDQYMVDILAIGDCDIADTIEQTFVLIRENEPTNFDNLNWVNESRSIVIEPFLKVGEPCTSWMCDIEEGYVPVRVYENKKWEYGWIKIMIDHQNYVAIKQYAYGLN